MTTTQTLKQSTVEGLQDLIKINIDSSKGFKKAAEIVESQQLATMFREYGNERDMFATELRRFVELSDADAEDSGSIKARVHRWWIDLVGSLKDGDEYTVLAEAERGEDAIKKCYEDVLPDIAGNPINDVLLQQYARVKSGHDRIRDMRDARKDS